MSKLQWNKVGENKFETGCDRGVLYHRDIDTGEFNIGYAWNGLTNVTKSPSGAEPNKQYADNKVYLNILSAEEFSFTIEAFTYPDEFAINDGSAEIAPGVTIGQQNRRPFGMSWRTLIGNDTEMLDHGYKIHVAYNALAAPTEQASGTVNESPEASAFSWECSTTPVEVEGTNPATGKPYKPTATLVVDSTKVPEANLTAIEDILYGTVGQFPRLPLPNEIIELASGAVAVVETDAPTYDAGTDIVTIPNVVGVQYSVNGEDVAAGAYGPITEDTVVNARAKDGYRLSETSDRNWTVELA